MPRTREQNIEVIKNYIPTMDMKTLTQIIHWKQLPNRILEEIACKCIREENDFYAREENRGRRLSFIISDLHKHA